MDALRCDTAIIGGGPSGLALAVHLQAAAVDVRVFEARERAGGNVRSEARDGFLCEWGPNGFLDNEPATLRLVEMLGLQDELVAANPMSEKRWVVRKGRLRAMPHKPLQFLFGDILSPLGKLRAGLEWTVPQRSDPSDESVFDFARRRVGREAAEVLVDAMITGIYAGDSRKLSLRSTLPRMAELESRHGGLFRAMHAIRAEKKRRATQHPTQGDNQSGGNGDSGADATPAWHKRRPATPMGPTGTLHSFVHGMQTLTDAMAQRLGERLQLHQELRTLQRTPHGWKLRCGDQDVEARRVVLSCPAWVAAPFLHDIDAPLALELAGIHSAPVTVACLGFSEASVEAVERGFGFLVPGREASPVLGTLYDTWVFPNRSQVGTVLFRTLLGGARHPEVLSATDDQVLELSLETLRQLHGFRAEPIMTHVIRHPRGIAQYNLGHADRLSQIDARLRELPGLDLTGNCYRGVALNACIREAEERARSWTTTSP